MAVTETNESVPWFKGFDDDPSVGAFGSSFSVSSWTENLNRRREASLFAVSGDNATGLYCET